MHPESDFAAIIYMRPPCRSAYMSGMQCYLCRYSTHPDSIAMHQFIEEHIGTMSLDALSNEVYQELANRVHTQNYMMDDFNTLQPCIIREHICTHTLNPVIRTGVMLRCLFELEDRMKNDLYKVDAQGQNLGLDPKMIDSYVKLQHQALSLYKCDPTRMMFKSQHTHHQPQ